MMTEEMRLEEALRYLLEHGFVDDTMQDEFIEQVLGGATTREALNSIIH